MQLKHYALVWDMRSPLSLQFANSNTSLHAFRYPARVVYRIIHSTYVVYSTLSV